MYMQPTRRFTSFACSRMWNDMIFVLKKKLDFDDKFGSTCKQ